MLVWAPLYDSGNRLENHDEGLGGMTMAKTGTCVRMTMNSPGQRSYRKCRTSPLIAGLERTWSKPAVWRSSTWELSTAETKIDWTIGKINWLCVEMFKKYTLHKKSANCWARMIFRLTIVSLPGDFCGGGQPKQAYQQGEPAVTDIGLKERHILHGREKKARLRKSRTLREDLEKHMGILPPEEEVTGSICLLPIENSFFFLSQQKFKQVSQWGHLWVERSTEKRGSCAEPDDGSTNAQATPGWTACTTYETISSCQCNRQQSFIRDELKRRKKPSLRKRNRRRKMWTRSRNPKHVHGF